MRPNDLTRMARMASRIGLGVQGILEGTIAQEKTLNEVHASSNAPLMRHTGHPAHDTLRAGFETHSVKSPKKKMKYFPTQPTQMAMDASDRAEHHANEAMRHETHTAATPHHKAAIFWHKQAISHLEKARKHTAHPPYKAAATSAIQTHHDAITSHESRMASLRAKRE